MLPQLQYSITNDPEIALNSVSDIQIRQFFKLQVPRDFRCSPLEKLENKNKTFYLMLEYYIDLLVKDSIVPEVKQKSEQIKNLGEFKNIQTFFGTIKDEFIDDQNFQQCLDRLSQTTKLNFQFITCTKNQTFGNFFGDPIKLLIYQQPKLQKTIYVLFAKRPKFSTPFPKFQTPVFTQNNQGFVKPQFPPQFQPQIQEKPPTQNVVNFNPFPQCNNQQNKPQFPLQGFQKDNQNPPQAPQHGIFINKQGSQDQNFHQKQKSTPFLPDQVQGQQPFIQVMQREIQSNNVDPQLNNALFTTEALNQKILPNNTITEAENSSQLNAFQPRNLVRTQNCDICCQDYKLDNEESILTKCCIKLPHKKCYLQNLNELGVNCNGFNKLKCYICQKQMDQNFLKNHLNKGIYCQIAALQAMLFFHQGQQVSFNQESNNKVCQKCFSTGHGDDGNCPELQQQILKALEGQPIILCPFCNQIQTKDDGCDHVQCAGCQNELCSECSCDRRPVLVHGNHFHRVGCQYCKGSPQDLSKKYESKRECDLCKLNKKCEKPISLDEYRKLKNY